MGVRVPPYTLMFTGYSLLLHDIDDDEFSYEQLKELCAKALRSNEDHMNKLAQYMVDFPKAKHETYKAG